MDSRMWPKCPKGTQAKIEKNAKLHMEYFHAFAEVFDRNLDEFWINSVRGFDHEGFARAMIRKQTRGKLVDAVRAEHGDEAAQLLRKLVPSGCTFNRRKGIPSRKPRQRRRTTYKSVAKRRR